MKRLLAALLVAVAAAVLVASAAAQTVAPVLPTTPGADPSAPTGLEPGSIEEAPTKIPGTPGGRGDWLANNGLSSPRCTGSRDASCLDSGTRAIPAPPGHYSLDSWMESGPLGLPKWSNIMSELTGFLWSGIVTVTVALFSALEWALNLDLTLLGGGDLGQLAILNEDWGMPLGVVMLVVGAIWVGIQARSFHRIGEALSGASLGFLLMGLSVAILSNPAGTIGQLTQLSGQAGREAASAPLKIVDRTQTLDTGLQSMWDVAIARPFGLLEFGDVDWATDPAQLDPKLLHEARRIAKEQGEHVQRRVASARTNADLFLIWPSNGDVRNSKDKEKCEGGPCLLNVLCGADDLTKCKGQGARLVSQRTDSGVSDRLGMVALVGLGMVSFWIVLGAIVFGLLWTSLSVIVTLLELAFVWPLALTFKPEWRQKVSGLQLRLLGAALAKIVFGIAAGITMTMLILIQRWDVGWVVQEILTVAGMVLLWMRRKAVTEYMTTLTGGEKTARGAGGLAGRLASSYVTGAGIGATRGKPGAGKAPGGPVAGPSGGGGVPTDLPKASGPGRGVIAGVATAGGLVAGPVGSAAAVALLRRQAIGAAGKNAAAGVSALGGRVAGGVDQGMRRTAGPSAAQKAAVPIADQSTALLASQERGAQQVAQARAEQERAQRLEQAQEAHEEAVRQHKYAQVVASSMLPGNPGISWAQEQLADSAQARQRAGEQLEAAQLPEHHGDDAAVVEISEPSAAALSKAEGWLDQQSVAAPDQRDYRRLAGVHGVTGPEFDAMEPAAQRQVKGAVDASLRARTSNTAPPAPRRPRPKAAPAAATATASVGGGARNALSRVASGQNWRQP